MANIPLCACGCGQAVTSAKAAYPSRGVKAGDFNTFVRGHNSRSLSRVLCACGCGHRVRRRTSRFLHGHNRRTETLEQRFWSFVDKSGDCWLWIGKAKASFGYGVIADRGTRRHIRAHRLAWELTNGPIPAGMLVLHRCDNPPCCNPAHLFLGDHADNARDRVSKGRSCRPKGLPDAVVLAIRTVPTTTLARREASERFQVSTAMVRLIQARRAYQHVQEGA